jgi:uncharacterized membrane protein YkvA (DUF1232 family)
MSTVERLLVVGGALLAAYVLFIAALLLAGRRVDAQAWARFIPDCILLTRRLLADGRVPRGPKLLLGALIIYVAIPIDLVPDFIPVIGHLDDAIVVALVVRTVIRAAGADVIREHWPGPEPSLNAVLRLAGQAA